MKIGFIGVGVMGKPMALHLSKHYEVLVYNRTHAKAKALEPSVKAYENLHDLIIASDVIISIVGYPTDVKETYDKILSVGKPGLICIDMTTSSPTLAKNIYEQALKKGIHVLDVPVTGGDLGARNQTLTMMAGGDLEIFNQVKNILSNFGSHIFYMGNAGSGQYAKLANQIAIASNICGLAESLAFAKTHGLDITNQLEILKSGSAGSFQANVFGAKMIHHDYEPGFFIKHFMKDLKLVMASKDLLPLSITETVIKAYEVLGESYDDLGTQAIFDFYLKTN